MRYSVTIVSPGTLGERPTLLIPFEPTAIVINFIDELWKRIARQNIPLAPNTHVATLHLDSETGAIIDCEDVLADIVTDPNEKLFAVFSIKPDSSPSPATPEPVPSHTATTNGSSEDGETMSVRIVTPALAKAESICPVIQLPIKSTLRQPHDRIAEHLHIHPKFEDEAEVFECNCKLVNQLADGPCPPTEFLVIHGKSNVQLVKFRSPTESALKEALRAHFGVDIETKKKVALTGADLDFSNPHVYKKPPVVAICSKQKHIPTHARVDIDESACMSHTIEEASLRELAVNGTVDIFVVNRMTIGLSTAAAGKSSIFRSRAHWETSVIQSNRGVAMFLSSLRVFVSLVEDMGEEERLQDAVLHVFDLLSHFPPAVRALHILVQGKTTTPPESAAISHAVFEILDGFVPTTIIGADHSRVFEGARLLFGFILEKARALKLPEEAEAILPYLSSFQTVDLRDYKTSEPVSLAVQTSSGLIEASLFDIFEENGVLANNHLQSFMIKTEIDSDKARHALLGAGVSFEVTVFSVSHLSSNYRYSHAGNVNAAIDSEEMSELDHLAELCGRNKLAVHKPSQLASAVAPCLTFDRSAHLAVYTGEQPCGTPGHSSILFRPMHGEETIDAAVIEQLTAPILRGYEADGTAVFDALGGAAVRKLQNPDEILMFCVDTSASMRQATDFLEVNDEVSDDEDEQPVVEAEFHNQASFDDLKERLCNYESFEDMVAIVAGTYGNKRDVALRVLDILRTMQSTEILQKTKDLEARRQHGRGWYYAREMARELETGLNELKAFYAGLKTHEDNLCTFLIYRANTASPDLTRRWTWSLGDAVPAATPPQQIPALPAHITELPIQFRCPISHSLMEDAVVAADRQTYSHTAIRQWLNIRTSSPLTGLPLDDTTVHANEEICDAARRWVEGDGIPGRDGQESKRLKPSEDIAITFDSKVGSFQRSVSPETTMQDLYRLAFRGLKAKFITFQLAMDRYGALTPSSNVSVLSRGIRNGDHVNIRIADDDAVTNGTTSTARRGDLVLIKVYQLSDNMEFAYWVKKDTTCTLASVLWKFWRHQFRTFGFNWPSAKQVWTDMSDSGDGLQTGSPRETSDRLSTYLTRGHCFGILGNERVYRESAGNSGIEDPLVLKVKVLPPWKQQRANNRLTRLDVLKQMFEALINRMLAYNYKTHVGLVTFASTCEIATSTTHILENFRRATHSMVAKGETALWDALALAKDQLVEYGKKYPDAKKRIICISDGQDTKSTANSSKDIAWRLHHAGIAVDSVSLGEEANDDLDVVSYLLGCYRFHPTSLANALAICEMEPFLSLSERPAIVSPPGTPTNRLAFMGHFHKVRHLATPTKVTSDSIPPRKEHPNLSDDFIEVSAASARRGAPVTAGSSTRSNLRISRLMNEIRQLANIDHPTYDVYISEADMSFIKVVVSGPEDSPYSEGTFVLYLHADEGYPTFPPKARFITKIKHPNVNMHGRICHPILDRDWTSDTSMNTLISTVYGLLYQPEASDPVNTTTTLDFHHDQVEFAEEVREHVAQYATDMSREDWRKEILGLKDEEENDDGNEDEDIGDSGV